MLKLQFLCTHHRHRLSENPTAASSIWGHAYSASLEFIAEYNYAQALRHAGAAFEIAELLLAKHTAITEKDISRFSDSGALLIQLLYRLDEARLASTILAAAIGRLEQLISCGEHRGTVLDGCQRLMQIGDDLPSTTSEGSPRHFPASTMHPRQIH